MNSHLFDNQAAIVTGAGQGIGFEIAKQLSCQGACVILNDANETLAADAARKIRDKGGECIAFAGDASKQDVIDAMVDEAMRCFGKLTITVANAGITLFGDFFEYPAENLKKVLEVNLMGSFLLTQAVARQMRSQKSGGRILLMSSVVGHQAHQFLGAYAMTKAGLEMLAKNLVLELSPHGITINTVAPGATLTERTLAEDPAYPKIWSAITPMGRPAICEDIANAALFLLSPFSGHITGQSLVVDGGWTSVSPLPDLSSLNSVK
ncbi:SDR family NAD(P)-dependent oxidoreductase [Dyadobacter sediminis]|uniref:SDR family oxidoreductase n=1 Tax=Dyadobacter sediminis TaxID=1493691 RepID=A0A5R9K979_9BACT|nr:SDR family oxidoreductase [Dyadobacter sediminis]TLU90598.1 SDR family oxidoreductase [Dyadobacter sediminis]GGC09087.1 3-hydroxybutyrate dehydrogenase [Dyadobacter sediminis]